MSLFATMFSGCLAGQVIVEPELRSGVYGTLLYITLDPADSIYSRTNGILLVLDKDGDEWNICTTNSCYDTTMVNGTLVGQLGETGIDSDGCEFTMTEIFTISSYPDGTGNVIDGLYSYELIDCKMESGESWYLEAYVFGMHIDAIGN